jgi:hypothetical protein
MYPAAGGVYDARHGRFFAPANIIKVQHILDRSLLKAEDNGGCTFIVQNII